MSGMAIASLGGVLKAFFAIHLGQFWYVRTPLFGCGYTKRDIGGEYSWFAAIPRIPLKEGQLIYIFNWEWIR